MIQMLELYPRPQKIKTKENAVNLNKKIEIEFIDKTLDENGLFNALNAILNEDASVRKTQTIYKCEIYYSSQIKAEGYALEVDTKKAVLFASDACGVKNGILTLNQLKTRGKDSVLACSIVDYPNILSRGIIEGFYGYPWTHNQRKELISYISKYKMNTYIYAPKDDQYHRAEWRQFYQNAEIEELTDLVKHCQANYVHFVWTIHPGDSIDLFSEKDFEDVLRKFEQLYAIGVRQFGILFDDITFNQDGIAQAQFINKINKTFIQVKKDVRPLITVGTRYCEAWGPDMTSYFKPFVETLDEDVEIMWTGKNTMSRLGKETFQEPLNNIITTKQLSAWWNYPVNDYCPNQLLIGKFNLIDSGIKNIKGFYSNPMNFAQSSKIALFMIADYCWNVEVDGFEDSYLASFATLDWACKDALKILAEHVSYLRIEGNTTEDVFISESESIRQELNVFTDSLNRDVIDSDKAKELVEIFSQIVKSMNDIEENHTNIALYKEIEPFVRSLKHLAMATELLLKGFSGESDRLNIVEEAKAILNECNRCKVKCLKDDGEAEIIVKAGSLILKPFADYLIHWCTNE